MFRRIIILYSHHQTEMESLIYSALLIFFRKVYISIKWLMYSVVMVNLNDELYEILTPTCNMNYR